MADRIFQIRFPQNNLTTNLGPGPYYDDRNMPVEPKKLAILSLTTMVTEFIKANCEEITGQIPEPPSVSQSEEETASNPVQSEFESQGRDQTSMSTTQFLGYLRDELVRLAEEVNAQL